MYIFTTLRHIYEQANGLKYIAFVKILCDTYLLVGLLKLEIAASMPVCCTSTCYARDLPMKTIYSPALSDTIR